MAGERLVLFVQSQVRRDCEKYSTPGFAVKETDMIRSKQPRLPRRRLRLDRRGRPAWRSRKKPRLAMVFGAIAVASLASAGAAQLPTPQTGSTSTKPITIDLQEAIRRARSYSPQFQTAVVNASVARENRLQARAARLPTVNAFNQFIYTEPNGTPSGVFIANDGVHVYNEQAIVRENLFSLMRQGQSRQAQAAEAVTLAQREIASRGLVFTVVQDYYNLDAAQRKIANANRSLQEAAAFVDVTSKKEQAGDVSHVDVVKAQLQFETRSRDLLNFRLAADQARLTLAVLLFPDFDQSFTLVDDLSTLPPLSSWDDVQVLAFQQNPELRSAQASLREAHFATSVARYGYLPSLALSFYYGIDANQFAAHSTSPVPGTNKSTLPNYLVPNRQNLGYAADVTLDIPIWNWGATRSKVRQAEYRRQLSEFNLTFAQRQLRANLRSLYRQAETAQQQVASLLRSRDFAAENVRLTLLRYQAGDATALEVASAEDASALALNAYADGLANFHVALANLQTLTGSL